MPVLATTSAYRAPFPEQLPAELIIAFQNGADGGRDFIELWAKFSKVRGHPQHAQHSLAVGRERHVLDGVDFPVVGPDTAWRQSRGHRKELIPRDTQLLAIELDTLFST